MFAADGDRLHDLGRVQPHFICGTERARRFTWAPSVVLRHVRLSWSPVAGVDDALRPSPGACRCSSHGSPLLLDNIPQNKRKGAGPATGRRALLDLETPIRGIFFADGLLYVS